MKKNIFLVILTIFLAFSFASCKNPTLDPNELLSGGGNIGGGDDNSGVTPPTPSVAFKDLAKGKIYGSADNSSLVFTKYEFSSDAKSLSVSITPDYFAPAVNTKTYTYQNETSDLVAEYKDGGSDTIKLKLTEIDTDKLLNDSGAEIANTSTTSIDMPSFINDTKGKTYRKRVGGILYTYQFSANGNSVTCIERANPAATPTANNTYNFTAVNSSSEVKYGTILFSISDKTLYQNGSSYAGKFGYADPNLTFADMTAKLTFVNGSAIWKFQGTDDYKTIEITGAGSSSGTYEFLNDSTGSIKKYKYKSGSFYYIITAVPNESEGKTELQRTDGAFWETTIIPSTKSLVATITW